MARLKAPLPPCAAPAIGAGKRNTRPGKGTPGRGSCTICFEVSFKMFTRKILNRNSKDVILKAFRLFLGHLTAKISFRNLKLISDVDDNGSGTIGLEVSFMMITQKFGADFRCRRR